MTEEPAWQVLPARPHRRLGPFLEPLARAWGCHLLFKGLGPGTASDTHSTHPTLEPKAGSLHPSPCLSYSTSQAWQEG